MTSVDDPMEWINGQQVPARLIDADEEISGTYRGSVSIQSGAHLRVRGTFQGNLSLFSGSRLTVAGLVQGNLNVEAGARALVAGQYYGPVHVATGGLLEVAASGLLAGPIHVEGEIRNEGVRGGPVSGQGTVADLSGSRVVPPTTRDGAVHYDF